MSKNTIPVIGIPGWIVKDGYFGVPLSYIRYASFWGIPRILGVEESSVDDNIDLLILPGGADVNPTRYSTIPYYLTSNPDVMKEYFDIYILPQYIEKEVPILGICRGLQTLAVHFGASLIQHISHPYSSKSRAETSHTIDLVDEKFRIDYQHKNGKKKIEVNSLHHQCVSAIDLPSDLSIVGIYTDKGSSTIEILKHRYLPIYGVQYHPEELTEDPLGDFIIKELLSKSKSSMTIEEVTQDTELKN